MDTHVAFELFLLVGLPPLRELGEVCQLGVGRPVEFWTTWKTCLQSTVRRLQLLGIHVAVKHPCGRLARIHVLLWLTVIIQGVGAQRCHGEPLGKLSVESRPAFRIGFANRFLTTLIESLSFPLISTK